MTLEQLRIFVAVAEREHVTQAARGLRLTQSATSAAVSALETRHAIKLFDRVGRRITLTEAGRLFLIEAKAVLARAASAELVLADLAGLKLGSLALAASQTVGNYWLPPLIHAFGSAYPGVSVALTMGNTETVTELVLNGSANIGFIEGEIEEPSLDVIAVARDEMAVMVSCDHPWAKTADVDLSSGRWVLRESGSGTRAMLDAMFRKADADPRSVNIVLELPTNEAVRTAVEAGAGATVLSKLVAKNALQVGNLVVVPYPVPLRSFFMLRHKERYVTAVEREFVSRIEAVETRSSTLMDRGR